MYKYLSEGTVRFHAYTYVITRKHPSDRLGYPTDIRNDNSSLGLFESSSRSLFREAMNKLSFFPYMSIHSFCLHFSYVTELL